MTSCRGEMSTHTAACARSSITGTLGGEDGGDLHNKESGRRYVQKGQLVKTPGVRGIGRSLDPWGVQLGVCRYGSRIYRCFRQIERTQGKARCRGGIKGSCGMTAS